mmetsp:Transcript_83270/g.269525  ORF Transcript_83270/g.269525 Transcript_83270/m.269525 type:complete len:327 (-) Transcript_83270:12-992(-)
MGRWHWHGVWQRAWTAAAQPSNLVHIGNGMAVCAMGSSDMLHLRSCLVFSNICNIGYSLMQRPPLLTPVAWGCFFIAGHGVQIVRLLRERQPVELSTEDAELFDKAFKAWGFSPRQFLRLLEAAPPSEVVKDKDEYLVRQGDDIEKIHYLMEGRLAVELDGVVLNEIRPGPGGWAGEFWGPNYDWVDRKHKWRVSFRCLDRCITAGFTKRTLHEAILVQGLPGELAAGRMQIYDLRSKLHVQRGEQYTPTGLPIPQEAAAPAAPMHHLALFYQSLLKKCVADGRISAEDQSLLDEHRRLFGSAVSEEQHQLFLVELGWTAEDYARG